MDRRDLSACPADLLVKFDLIRCSSDFLDLIYIQL